MNKNRRSLLKGIGATIGLPSLTVSEISVNAAARPESIVQHTKPFLHFTFKTAREFPTANKSVGCRTWPTVDTHSGKQTGTENQVYITEFARQSINFEMADGILLSHEGFNNLHDETEVSFSHIPSQSSLVGGVEFLDDTIAPSLKVNLGQSECHLSFDGTDTTLEEGEAQEFTHTTQLSSGENAELIISAAYYGDVQLFGHTEKILVPQSTGWSNFVQAVKDMKQQSRSASNESATTRLQVTEYEGVNAFGIDVSSNDQVRGE